MGSSTKQAEQRRLRVVAFVDGRLRGLSNKDSAIAAGCNEKTASAAGSRMAKSTDVLGEIKRRGAEMAAASRLVDPIADSTAACVSVGDGVDSISERLAMNDALNASARSQAGVGGVTAAAVEKVGLSDDVLAASAVKWVDGTSFLLAVVNAPRADLKIRVDAAFKLERIKAGFGAGKEKTPSLFDNVPASADAWAAQGGSRAH